MARRTLSIGFLLTLPVSVFSWAQSVPPGQLSPEEVFNKVAPSVAVILVGEGAGRMSGVGSGVVLRPDGVVFTAHHVIKNANEVQVRLPNGEAYDTVDLVGFDERRDVAALRVSASELAALAVAPVADLKPGQTIYVVSNPKGLNWSISAGVLSAIRPADEVPGAGSGYRVLQFTAPVSPGSSGGVVVDSYGRAVGIVVAMLSEGQNINFAVPIESVLGLADGTERIRLGSGRLLDLPKPERSPSAAAAAEAKPAQIVYSAKTIYIRSQSEFAPVEPLQAELAKQKLFQEWGMVFVKDWRSADLIIELDRPLFTWDFTFSIADRRTSVVLGTGKVVAWDGVRAAPSLSDQIIKQLKRLREGPAAKENKEATKKK